MHTEQNDVWNITQLKRQNHQNDIRRSIRQHILSEKRGLQLQANNRDTQGTIDLLPSQDRTQLMQSQSLDRLFQKIDDLLRESMAQAQEDRMLGLLTYCHQVVSNERNCVQNIFYQNLLETFQALLSQPSRTILIATLKNLVNIFAQDFCHTIYYQQQEKIYLIVRYFITDDDFGVVDFSSQCLANIFCDQKRLANHFTNNHLDLLQQMLASFESKNNSSQKLIMRSNVMRMLYMSLGQNQNISLDIQAIALPMIEDSVVNLMTRDLFNDLLMGEFDVASAVFLVLSLVTSIVQSHVKEHKEPIIRMLEKCPLLDFLVVVLDIRLERKNHEMAIKTMVNLACLNENIADCMANSVYLDLLNTHMKTNYTKIKAPCLVLLQNLLCTKNHNNIDTIMNHGVWETLGNYIQVQDLPIKKEVMRIYINILNNGTHDQITTLLSMPLFYDGIKLLFDFQEYQCLDICVALVELALIQSRGDPSLYNLVIHQIKSKHIDMKMESLQYVKAVKMKERAMEVWSEHLRGKEEEGEF